ncbi:Transmembrane domain-containing protein [Orpheovirus IHUMI-LCC2]|uniref:Transmembrane domain-containing protein n=1 Tax=Orpheovirus IHUMI-LCC2 TaxID=2023057 RepID=A0A2I2L485_9VIRU|nr:Transmembrane domain-containing protein [Orpheovirus IHUMI-LCC2]SNW62343.1 Transmembrane domain-containing protein [Orpheovirus IHUMI-LCC2]
MSSSKGKTILSWIVFIIIIFSSFALFGLSIYWIVDYENELALPTDNCSILDVPECIIIDNNILYKLILDVPNCGNQTIVTQTRRKTITNCHDYVSTLLNTTIPCVLENCKIIERRHGSFLIVPITLMLSIALSYILICSCINKDCCGRRRLKFDRYRDIMRDFNNKKDNIEV